MKTRISLAAIGLLLALAPAAGAATTASFDDPSNTVTLTNDGDGETFTVFIDDTVNPNTYAVTVTNGTIADPVPAGSNCTRSEADKKLTCNTGDVSLLIINGGEGPDTFTIGGVTYYGGTPGVQINGDAGDDTFTGTDAPLGSRIKGGLGNDTFNGSPGLADEFYAEPGNDTYHGGTKPVPPGWEPETYQALSAIDRYTAPTEGAPWVLRRVDVPVNLSLDGQANDADGMSGTDNLSDDIESLFGTEAGDTLSGGAHSVYLYGQGGDDVITGSSAGDDLSGARGSDQLRGGGGPDELYDGDYDPPYRLAADPAQVVGNDLLDGGAGDDELIWGAGADDVAGGGGVDTGRFARVQTQTVESYGPDLPAVTWYDLSISLDGVANDGAAGEGDNVRPDLENIDTSSTEYDVLDRRSAVTRGLRIDYSDQSASRASDTITGTDGVNVISTGKGNDSVDAKGGADQIDLGGGDDQVNAIDRTTDVIACGGGADNAGVDLPGTNPGRADALTDCENVTGTALGLEGGVLPTLPVVPKVTLGGGSTIKSKTFLKNYTVGVGVTTDQPSTVAGELTTTQAKIAKVGALSVGSGKLASGSGQRTLKLKVAKKYRKKLKRKLRTKKQRRKGIKLSAVVTVTNASGQSATSRRTIKIKG